MGRWMTPVSAAIDFLAAERCIACARSGARRGALGLGDIAAELARPISLHVLSIIPITNRPFCLRCLLMLREAGFPQRLGFSTEGGTVALENGEIFGEPGLRRHALTPLDVLPAFHTNSTLLAIVHQMKFARFASLTIPLAAALAQTIRGRWQIDRALLVPVPMDRRTRRERGFDPVVEIATNLSATLAVPVAIRALKKPRRISRQSTLSRRERGENVRDAFQPGCDSVAGHNVVLVDDLITTGATAASCAACLLAAGAATVTVAGVGRTPPPTL